MGTNRRNIYAIALGLFLAIVFGALPAGAMPIVGIQPPLLTPALGGFFDVYVEISSVTDLYAFQFDIRFDPAILSAIGVSEGSFLMFGGSTFFIPGSIDNTEGTVSFTADALEGVIGGMSGGGTLAVLQFQALAVGSIPIDLLNVKLLDSSADNIPFSSEGGTINAVPESSTMFILAPNLIMLIGLSQKFRKRSPLLLYRVMPRGRIRKWTIAKGAGIEENDHRSLFIRYGRKSFKSVGRIR